MTGLQKGQKVTIWKGPRRRPLYRLPVSPLMLPWLSPLEDGTVVISSLSFTSGHKFRRFSSTIADSFVMITKREIRVQA